MLPGWCALRARTFGLGQGEDLWGREDCRSFIQACEREKIYSMVQSVVSYMRYVQTPEQEERGPARPTELAPAYGRLSQRTLVSNHHHLVVPPARIQATTLVSSIAAALSTTDSLTGGLQNARLCMAWERLRVAVPDGLGS